MKDVLFTKMQGSGNDFVVIDGRHQAPGTRHQNFGKKICDRKYGVGADGVLLLERSKRADARMRIINPDGSEAQMCGNGARCAAFFISRKATGRPGDKKKVSLETKAGIIEAQVKGECVKIKLTDPTDVKLDIPVQVGAKIYNVDFVNTGVPHAVIETDDLDGLCVKEIGRALRHHKVFAPKGTNVNFIKVDKMDAMRVRTYERGVEDETLACGTGSVASAIISVLNRGTHGESQGSHRVSVGTRGGEVLAVYFKVSKYNISDVWLEGKAQIVFSGVIHG